MNPTVFTQVQFTLFKFHCIQYDTNWIFSNVVTSFKFNYIKYDPNCIFFQILFTLFKSRLIH